MKKHKADTVGISAKARIILGLSLIAVCTAVVCLVPTENLVLGQWINTPTKGTGFSSRAELLIVTSLIGVFLVSSGVLDQIRKR